MYGPMMPLRQTAHKGTLTLAVGINRFPRGRLNFAWHGFYVHNLSENYVYLDMDEDADENRSFRLYDWEWRDFDGHIVQKQLTFYVATVTTIYLYAYQYLSLIDPFTGKVGDPAAPLANEPMVADPQFGPKPRRPLRQFDLDDGQYDTSPRL